MVMYNRILIFVCVCFFILILDHFFIFCFASLVHYLIYQVLYFTYSDINYLISVHLQF